MNAPWSWRTLGLWLLQSSLVALVAVGLLFGPSLADVAWDLGVHVTPAQAAMHAALEAQGFTHHHHHATSAAVQSAGSTSGAALQPGGTGMTWGSAYTPAIHPAAELPLAAAAAFVHAGDTDWPPAVELTPPSPPPR